MYARNSEGKEEASFSYVQQTNGSQGRTAAGGWSRGRLVFIHFMHGRGARGTSPRPVRLLVFTTRHRFPSFFHRLSPAGNRPGRTGPLSGGRIRQVRFLKPHGARSAAGPVPHGAAGGRRGRIAGTAVL